ncbi:hypothetical protein D9611_006300 [Ephemerocybe angulata]|uniref:Uncharacterized protein n=1 Tax=Ephemerocybe angulata TaxID=980116 RepID=A0A8H5FGW5_9AGAR|nr:hypothetical protein D9611_006300 [Tulosesus angulatus]
MANGIYGILGLAFQHGTASPINLKIKKRFGMEATWGRSVLHNISNQTFNWASQKTSYAYPARTGERDEKQALYGES